MRRGSRFSVFSRVPADFLNLLPGCGTLPLHIFQRLSLRFRANMRVPREHLPRDVTRNLHDRLVAGAILGEFGDQRVPIVLPATGDARFPADVVPGGLQRADGLPRVFREATAARKIRTSPGSRRRILRVPTQMIDHRRQQRPVQGDATPSPSIRL